MKLANFTIEQLKALPLRAIVAFAARCARRVEHLAQLPEGNPQSESRREAIEAALRMAESFARGTDAPPDDSMVAAIDASRDAGGELACATAASAAAQAAHAAASAWHVGFQRAEESRAPGKPTTEARRSLGPLTRVTADTAALNAYTARGGVRRRRLPQRGLRRRGPARLQDAGRPRARPISGAGSPGRSVPGRAAGPPVTGGRPNEKHAPRANPGPAKRV